MTTTDTDTDTEPGARPGAGGELVRAPHVNGAREAGESPIDLGAMLAAAPGLARIAAAAWLRTAEWTASASWNGYVRLVRGAISGEPAADLLSDLGSDARAAIRRLLDLADSSTAGRTAPARAQADADGHSRSKGTRGGAPRRGDELLRERGEDLLRRSADVAYEEPAHPAFARILDELAPDEARVLRFLCREGPQPAVDVRTGRALSISTSLVAPGLSMIGAQAGCRYMERVPAYLNNLYRLGLIWFSREPLEDPLRYQVLEAQPEVSTAMRSGGRGRTVRRSIHLTPFGEDFCETCLPPGS